MSQHDLSGRSAIVTGASRGLGLEIARALGLAGARVMVCARDAPALEAAAETLSRDGLDVIAEVGDVSNAGHVERIVAVALECFGTFQILVNNAGVYGPKGLTERTDWAEWVRTIEINLFGSVLMSRAVIPHFRSAGYGKIVQLSGGGATGPLPHFSAYAASKAAIVRFAETLAYEMSDSGVDVNAIAPGALNTRMLDEVIEAGAEIVGADFYARALSQHEQGGTPLALASALTVYLCSAASDGVSGRLLSAVWDSWDLLTSNKEALAASDVYTLRRIVPEDRGLEWNS